MIVADLEARLQDVFARSGFRGTFSVVADYELQPGDCRLEWDGGGADRDEARIWRDIRDVDRHNLRRHRCRGARCGGRRCRIAAEPAADHPHLR